MEKSRELIFIRYISFGILLFQIFIQCQNSSIVSIIFILLFIINNNIRIFYFKSDIEKIISILIELALIPLAQLKFGGYILIYLIGVIIDIFTLNNKKVKYIYAVIIIVIAIMATFGKDKEASFINFIIIELLYILLSYIARLYSTKLEAQKLYDKLRVSEEKLIEVNKELEGYVDSIEEITLLKERNRISREIHDSVGHALSTAMIQLTAMEAIAEKENSTMKNTIKKLRSFINDSFQDVKRAVRELKSDQYENYKGILRLQDVCKNFQRMTGIEVKVIISKGQWNLSTKQVNHLYRITQEVLSNSLKHGKASTIKVIMNFTDSEFIISFSDDGIGTYKIVESGVGLKSIKERAEEIEATVDMRSVSGKGFFVRIIVPKEVEV
ncbi:Sensor Kinase [Clostridium bornimense]|uniref:histidine kinase n=1 Tax=Clostridium bornimense TaxID=1216932 RepID=W6S3E3_9CLOT|nr:sensor histidine kinase [Clostridium bornimense]CDM70409.1 Sensor Kinase [Clostridium bornimense]